MDEKLFNIGLRYAYEYPSHGRAHLYIIHNDEIIFQKKTTLKGIQPYNEQFINDYCIAYLRDKKINDLGL
jgi:hypothetical protein